MRTPHALSPSAPPPLAEGGPPPWRGPERSPRGPDRNHGASCRGAPPGPPHVRPGEHPSHYSDPHDEPVAAVKMSGLPLALTRQCPCPRLCSRTPPRHPDRTAAEPGFRPRSDAKASALNPTLNPLPTDLSGGHLCTHRRTAGGAQLPNSHPVLPERFRPPCWPRPR